EGGALAPRVRPSGGTLAPRVRPTPDSRSESATFFSGRSYSPARGLPGRAGPARPASNVPQPGLGSMRARSRLPGGTGSGGPGGEGGGVAAGRPEVKGGPAAQGGGAGARAPTRTATSVADWSPWQPGPRLPNGPGHLP